MVQPSGFLPNLKDTENPTPISQKAIRAAGHGIGRLMIKAPWLWPLMRGPVREFFDRRANGWDERTGAGGPSHLTPLAAALTKIEEPERALELGTGTGVGALLIAREFPRCSVRGVDISVPMIEQAQERIGLDPEARVSFRVADASKLPFDDGSFDLVAQLNLPPFLDETARVLRPGGYFVTATSWGQRTPFHVDPGDLEEAASRRGLHLVESAEIGDGEYSVFTRQPPPSRLDSPA